MFFLLTQVIHLDILRLSVGRKRQSWAVVATLFEPGLLEKPGRALTVSHARFLRLSVEIENRITTEADMRRNKKLINQLLNTVKRHENHKIKVESAPSCTLVRCHTCRITLTNWRTK